MIPKSFLTEIQHDEVYETILEELRKKIPHLPSKPAPIQEEIEEEDEEEGQKLFSPHLLAIDDDDDNDDDDEDDDLSISDVTSSAPSSEHTRTPTQDDYDTDIESGEQRFHSAIVFFLSLNIA